MINNKVKALLQVKGLGNSDGAKALDINYQSFSNKLNRNGFKAEDLVKLANFTNTTLAFVDQDGSIVVKFDISDIKESE